MVCVCLLVLAVAMLPACSRGSDLTLVSYDGYQLGSHISTIDLAPFDKDITEGVFRHLIDSQHTFEAGGKEWDCQLALGFTDSVLRSVRLDFGNHPAKERALLFRHVSSMIISQNPRLAEKATKVEPDPASADSRGFLGFGDGRGNEVTLVAGQGMFLVEYFSRLMTLE